MKLRYTRPALADLNAILDYIAAQSPQAAQRVQARIRAVADLLLLHPNMGRRTSDPTIRRMRVMPYQYLSVMSRPALRSLLTLSGIQRAIRRACRVSSDVRAMRVSFGE